MFTGIVETVGEVVENTALDGGSRLEIGAEFSGSLDTGQSVSVNGVCLTVEDNTEEKFEVFLSDETMEKTYLSQLSEGSLVNLERALGADERLDGHFVQGHVDGVTTVTSVERVGDDWMYGFELPHEKSKYVVEKGSVSLDGISLTVADIDENTFKVAVIPETHEVTNLSEKEVGDPMNFEVDIIAKYVESVLGETYLG